MVESTFLSGAVVKRVLPTMQGRPGPDAPIVKRLLLPQGELAQLFDGEPPMRYIACIELRAGKPRGNHYHNLKQEWVYVMQGKATMLVEDIGSKVREAVPLQAGDLVVIRTGIAHTMQPVTDGLAIEFSPAPFNSADIYAYPLR